MKLTALAAAMGMLVGGGAFAADTNVASQDVGYQIDEVALISVDGDPGDLVINTTVDGAAGAILADDTDASSTWAITSNKGTNAKKVTAVLTGDMPAHTELFITLAAPTGAVSEGTGEGENGVSLNTRSTGAKADAQDVVTGIDPVAESDKTITYRFSADVEAGVVPRAEAEVTLTLTNT
ncbi:hypothetical protein [Thiocapsa rosea]|nr:hypothetical protein [Thiocapsa rosea]